MKIGILGAGNIGGTLGRALAARGHEVMLGVRTPQSTGREAGAGRFGTMAEAVATFADATCLDAFDDYVGLPYDGSYYIRAAILPTAETWPKLSA